MAAPRPAHSAHSASTVPGRARIRRRLCSMASTSTTALKSNSSPASKPCRSSRWKATPLALKAAPAALSSCVSSNPEQLDPRYRPRLSMKRQAGRVECFRFVTRNRTATDRTRNCSVQAQYLRGEFKRTDRAAGLQRAQPHLRFREL